MSLPPTRNRKGPRSSNEKGEGGREDDSNEKGEGGREDDPAATERATTPSRLSPPPPQKQRRLRLPNPRFSDSTYSSIPGRANSEAPDVPGASGKKPASPSTPSSPSDELRLQRRQRRRQRRPRELPDAAPAKESEPGPTSHGWNLRRRRPAAGADDLAEFRTSAQTLLSLRLAPDSANPKSARKPRPAFSFALSREEIDADFLKISGTKPCARPKKKRPSSAQNVLNLFPGNPLSAIITNSISNKI